MGTLAAAFLVIGMLDAPSVDDDSDRAFLKQLRLASDTATLHDFFQKRTLDDAKVKRLRELIAALGDARYAVRDKAAKDLLVLGIPGLKFLEPATNDPDTEIGNRAQKIVDQIRAGPGASLPLAAIRLMRKQPTNETISILLAYLPFADERVVEEEVIALLVRIGRRDGVVDARIRQVIASPFPSVRAAAASVLGHSPNETDRAATRNLLGDVDSWVRFSAAVALLDVADKAAPPTLIALLQTSTGDISWRSEELLLRLAGENNPPGPTDEKPETRQAYQQAWAAWWNKAQATIDLTRIAREPPVLGLFLGIEYNTNSVWECGRDGKRRWTVSAEGPMDAQVLPGNRVLIAEQSAKRVTERDLKGNILWSFPTDEETINCQRLPNGNTFIGTRRHVLEVRPDKTVVYKHELGDAYLHGVRRLPNGHFVGLTGGGVIHEIAANAKDIRKFKVNDGGTWGDILGLSNGRFLLTNYGTGFVREVDATGKTIRELKLTEATGIDVLPGGQLLVAGHNKAVIVDWSGKVSWEVKSDGCIRRIHRR